jgi:hypothetical protein
VKKRKKNVKIEKAGIIAVEAACLPLDLIWRPIVDEDVGVDGTIEIAVGDFPTGKIVGVQVKSGESYFRSATDATFTFYADQDDLKYWKSLSIPLFLLVHDPSDGVVYWKEISSHLAGENDTKLVFSRANVLNDAFAVHLRRLFDLEFYTDEQYAQLKNDLDALRFEDGERGGRVVVTGTDLFVQGLWGLCSKLQFHSSIITDLFRERAAKQTTEVRPVAYTLSRETLYPFLTSYINVLTTSRLALIDTNDIHQSMYTKLELPTFLAPLTTNGRRFVEYLRLALGGRVSDHQFFTLSLTPHTQIEAYKSFVMEAAGPTFGRYTDVIAIRFNAYLDYYQVQHIKRDGDEPRLVVSQTIFQNELQQYIEAQLDGIPKDHLVIRHMDTPLSALACWIMKFADDTKYAAPTDGDFPKSNANQSGFLDEMVSIFAGVGTMSVEEPGMPPFPVRRLANGEKLPEKLGFSKK